MNAMLARAQRAREQRRVATAAVAAVVGAPLAQSRKRKAGSSDDSRKSGAGAGAGGGGGNARDDDYIQQASETASGTVFEAEHHSERSVRDRSLNVSVTRMENSAVSLRMSSADDSGNDNMGRGAIRAELSSVHVDEGDSSQAVEAVVHGRAPAVPVHLPGPGASSQCAVCREQFQQVFENNLPAANPEEGTTARASKAQSAIREMIANRYEMIFQVEAAFRGRTHDDNIIDCMLDMHRSMVEVPSRTFGLGYTVWTAAILREHFDPMNEHMFDEVREIKTDLRNVRRVLDYISRHCLVPSAANAAHLLVDTRMTLLMTRLSTHKVKLLSQLGKTLRTKDHQIANVIHNALGVLKQQDSADGGDRVMSDPNMAAGTLAAGGDAMRSANISNLNGGAFGIQKLSGY